MSAHGLLARGPPPQPKWLLYLRIAILVMSLIILAIAAYAISAVGSYYYGGTGAGGFLIFLCIKSFIVYGGTIAVEIWAPNAFFRIVALILYCFSVIFWLSGWAWSASSAAFWLSTYCYLGTCVGPAGYSKSVGGALAACAALGAITWILCIVNLVFFVKACLADPHGTRTTPAHNAELGQVKHQKAHQAGATQPGYNEPTLQQQGEAGPQHHYGEPQPYQQQTAHGHQQQPYGEPQPYTTQ